jgi:FAD dependent oxidoreductase
MKRRTFLRGAAAGAAGAVCRPVFAATPPQVVVYGATPSGIMAAYAAAREGMSVTLLGGPNFFGGMCTNGLNWSDVGNTAVIGGLAADFFLRIGRQYGKSEPVYQFESHVAKRVFKSYLKEGGIAYSGRDVAAVQKDPTRQITKLLLTNGDIVTAELFIDASYEGDLMAFADVGYRFGRESEAEYGESLAGYDRYPIIWDVSAYTPAGTLQLGVRPAPDRAVGAADHTVQDYGFRLTLTGESGNRVPFWQPPGYNRAWYWAWSLQFPIGSFPGGALPNGKYDRNFDFPGMSWRWALHRSERPAIWNAHFNFEMGMFWFLQTDPSIPAATRQLVAEYGLAADEYVGGRIKNWPDQLYVREARRLDAQYILREQDQKANGSLRKRNVVFMWGYDEDIHACGLYATPDRLVNLEGSGGVGAAGIEADATVPYDVPLDCLVPSASDCVNLLVPVCLGASHVAFGSVRCEAAWMMAGEAAGVAAASAVQFRNSVQNVDVLDVQQTLLKYGAILSLPSPG